MGLESVFKLSVILNMVDQMSNPLGKAQESVGRLQESFRTAGEKISAAGSKIQSVGDSLTSSITKPALAATGALAGIALKKGFDRLIGIDDARAKLKGLGHDAESVSQIMSSALDSVRGTSYGMDAAATTAAGAVAAGVEKGEALTRYLSLTADAAAIAGASMSDMGSIINKVQTSQKAYTENLNQLADRGIPIYQWIGSEAGVTADQVKDMASKGKISSEMFLNAIEKNIGGAAKTMGESSFKSSIANIGASISRIGANFLDAGGQGGGFFSTLKPLLSDFNNSLGILEEKAKDLGVKFGDAFNKVIKTAQEMKARFDGLSPPVKSLILKVAGIGAAVAVGIGPALKGVGGLVKGFGTLVTVLPMILSPIGLIVIAVVGLVVAFGVLMAKNAEFREKVIGIWNNVRDRVSGVIDGLKPKLSTMFDGIKSSIEPIVSAMISTIIPVIETVMQAFSGFFSGLKSGLQGVTGNMDGFGSIFKMVIGMLFPPLKIVMFLFQNFGSQIKELVSTVASQVVPIFTTLGATIGGVVAAVLPALQSVIASLLPVIGQMIDSFMEVINAVLPVLINLFHQLAPFIVKIAQMIGEIVSALAPMIAQLVSSLLPVITNIIKVIMNVVTAIMPAVIAILNVIMAVIKALIPVITMIIQVVINVVTAIMNVINPIIAFIGLVISTIMSIITPIVTYIANIIAVIIDVIGTVIGTVSDIFSTVSNVINGIWAKISDKVSSYITAISTVIATITGAVSGVFNKVYDTISGVFNRARDFVKGVIDKIRGFFNFSWSLPKIKMPHVKISGGFSLTPPSVPKFDIDWYKDGGILNGATIFGAQGGKFLGGGEAGAEAVLPLATLWKQMRDIVSNVVRNENEDNSDDVRQTGTNITNALTSKAGAVRKERESSTTKEIYKSEGFIKEGATVIHNINVSAEVSKIKDLPLLFKLIDELKDAQNRTDDATLQTT